MVVPSIQEADVPMTTWARFKRWMFPKHEKKWSRAFIINLVSGVFLAWLLFFEVFGSRWHIGVDPQVVKCLPWDYYLLYQRQPSEIAKNRIYRYTSRQLGTVIPAGTQMVKYAAAIPGDIVRVDHTGIYINGNKWGDLNATTMEKTQTRMGDIVKTYVVEEGQVLMLGTLPRSYDGRYFGTVSIKSIEGRAIPLW